MKIKQAALVTLVGMSVSFFLRSTGTLFPGILLSHYFFRFSVLIHFLAALLLLHFFLCLYRAFSIPANQKLRRAVLWAVWGTTAVLPLHLKSILLVFHIPLFPLFVQYHHMDATLPLAGSALVLVFFIVFYRKMPAEKSRRLNNGIAAAGVGYFIFTLLHGVGFLNYMLAGKFVWVFQSGWWVFGVTLCAFVLIFYFLLTFYQTGDAVFEQLFPRQNR